MDTNALPWPIGARTNTNDDPADGGGDHVEQSRHDEADAGTDEGDES